MPFGPDVILFDLDGTVIHSEAGIHISLRAALAALGIEPTDEELAGFMGPPLAQVLERLYGITDPAAIQLFSEGFQGSYFHAAEYEFEVYPGLPALLEELGAAGVTLALATAKPHESATRIIDRAGLGHLFAFVAGSENDNSRQDKAEVIAHALAGIDADVRTHRVVMVGDRDLDIRAARSLGIDGIAVTWGYGTLDELSDCGAIGLADDADALRALLLA